MLEEFIQYCKENQITLGTCESCTGGLFASRICDFAGVSQIYKGSIVSYDPQVKMDIAHVKEKTIQTFGVVSKEVALEMAIGAQKALKVDCCISITGNAGPGVCDHKPVGCVFVGVAYKEELTCFELQLNGTRNEIRQQIIEETCNNLKKYLSF